MEKVKFWSSPRISPDERRPLMSETQSGYFTTQPPSISGTEGEVDDDSSSNDFPSGYDAHYAMLPSISDQKLSQHREMLLFCGTIVFFVAAFALLLTSTLLVTTSRRRLRAEVDAGVIVGVVASLSFAALGFTIMLSRFSRLGWLHISCVAASFLATSVVSGLLLVVVMGNARL